MNIWELIMIKVRAAFKSHTEDANAHHARYTDAEAAAAVAAVDAYVKKIGDTINGDITLNGQLTMHQQSYYGLMLYGYDLGADKVFEIYRDYYNDIQFAAYAGRFQFDRIAEFHQGIDLHNKPLAHVQEFADATLSGDAKIFSFKDSTGVYYYVKGYKEKT